MTNRKQLIDQLNDLYENDQHETIIYTLKGLPASELDYELTGHLARAHNNLDEYDEAIALLTPLAEQAKDDAIWHFRLAYAFYYGDKENLALPLFERSFELGDELAKPFIARCKYELEMELTEDETTLLEEDGYFSDPDLYDPDLYEEEEMDAIEAHIKKRFGKFSNVFHELVSPDLHIDLVVVEPTPERNYYTIVTMGAGAFQMNVPEKYDAPRRIELLITLPPDWNLSDTNDEKWYWPLRWLKILARFPKNEDTWLGWGHTIPKGEPFADNTNLCCILLTMPYFFGEEAASCTLPNGEEVAFFQMLPLYEEEMNYKIASGTEELENLFSDDFNMVLDIDRPSVV